MTMTDTTPTEGIDPKTIDFAGLGEAAAPEARDTVAAQVDQTMPEASSRDLSEIDRVAPVAAVDEVLPMGAQDPEATLPAPDETTSNAPVEAANPVDATLSEVGLESKELDPALRTELENVHAAIEKGSELIRQGAALMEQGREQEEAAGKELKTILGSLEATKAPAEQEPATQTNDIELHSRGNFPPATEAAPTSDPTSNEFIRGAVAPEQPAAVAPITEAPAPEAPIETPPVVATDATEGAGPAEA